MGAAPNLSTLLALSPKQGQGAGQEYILRGKQTSRSERGLRTFPKLPFPSTIRKLKSDSFIRSRVPLLSNLEMAFGIFSSAALEPGPILAL